MSRVIISFAGHLLAAALMAASPFSASAQERVALVVGNGAYTHAIRLPNPANDAADMAASLRELGFEVISAVDADKTAFDAKLRDFAKRLRGARTALFYYAGHGLQVAGKNYAVPVDARLEAAADLPVETVDIDQVLSVMQADENRINLVFLDACRDNPLTRSFARALPATRSTSVGTGLSAVNAGRGTLIAYATAPNQVALDGARTRNSPFTAALLRHIGTPGLDIALVMRRVTADVEAASGGAQSPWVHASLTRDVVLKGGTAPAYLPPAASGPAVASVDPNARVAPRPDIAAPNESLPTDISIPPDVLTVVETHPFFATAPSPYVRSYRIDWTSNNNIAGRSFATNVQIESSIRWLRAGIVEVNSIEDSNQTHGNSLWSSIKTDRRSLAAANGLISLAYKSSRTGKLSPIDKSKTVVYNGKLLRLENLSGQVFPVRVGTRFSFDQIWETTGTDADELTTKSICEVTRAYAASRFHSSLTGNAYLLICDSRMKYRKNKSWNNQLQLGQIFFESLGYWIDADPVSPKERVVNKYADYALKSVQLER